MANNVNTGFKWVRSRMGADRAPIEERVVASAYGTAIALGDCVKLVSDGTIAACAAGDAVYGVSNGAVRYKDSAGVVRSGNAVPISTTYTGSAALSNPQASVVQVIPAQGQVFEADANTAAATLAAAQDSMFNNCDIVATASTVATGRSNHVIDYTGSFPGTGTAQWRLLEIVPDPLNDVTAVNWKVRVTLNEGTEPIPGTATGT